MFLTDRQKQLLFLLLVSPKGVSIKKIEERLQISRRTVYREFSNLKETLATRNLQIINDKGKYFFSGNKQSLAQIKDAVRQAKEQTIMSVTQRENAIAAQLLINDQPCKIIELALELEVSEATIQNDLNAVAESLARYHLDLTRRKGIGIAITGAEIKKREVLVDILANEINEYDFFKFLHHKIDKPGIFLRILDSKLLLAVAQTLDQSIVKQIKLNTDQKLIELILFFTITLERIVQGHTLTLVKPAQDSLKYQGYVYRFFAVFEENRQITVTQNEINYLAAKVKECDYQQIPFQYKNNYELELSEKVKKFIALVSEKMKVNFQKNPAFVAHLTQHIFNLIQQRVTLLPDAKIDSLTGLSQRFATLYQVIQTYWRQVFPDEQLTTSEMQLILVYFAKEYTSSITRSDLSALVVCENGIGTSAILRERIKQEIPEIKEISLSRVSNLNNLDLKNYDLVLSTLKLKGFSRDYLLVSPLLLDDEIQQIRAYLKKYQQKYSVTKETDVLLTKRDQATKKLTQFSIDSLFFAELVNGVRVRRLEYNSEDLITVIQECLAHSDPTLIRKQITVAKKLLKRIRLAPVGLPNSNLALLHTSSDQVTRCAFMVFDLDNAISLKAMDHTDIQVTRILLMLSPAELSDNERAALSMVSSMIIMNDDNLKLFTTGSQNDIKDLIAIQFLSELKRHLLAK
ncbi:MAG: HTH domain-containing protein [Candidatus Lactobacillus pullistercoris]|uniref:HTH domain-containing protein n=1 Tax=Candidatus Lactobacillus pullistercoris TaxID=2838636 RepID=A0A9E2KSN0_9LACO|nr:HTH domain-containing protein [Candidatus Lactobacillus pullistercoris]